MCSNILPHVVVLSYSAWIVSSVREPSTPDPERDHYEAIRVGDGLNDTITPTKQMQSLLPRVGACYIGDNALAPAVLLWRERKHDYALKLLQQVVKDKGMDSNEGHMAAHLMIDIAQLHDEYQLILENVEAILKSKPDDLHALFVRAMYKACALETGQDSLKAFISEGEKIDDLENTREWISLQEASSAFADALRKIIKISTGAWHRPFEPVDVVPVNKVLRSTYKSPIVIAVFGWGPITGNKTSGWEALPPMRDRIIAADKLARKFEDATIIASGGAVSSAVTEGVFIKDELLRLGKGNEKLRDRIVVDPSAQDSEGNVQFISKYVSENVKGKATLLLVGSDWQDPRYKATVETSLEGQATVVAVGAGFAWNSGKTDPTLDKELAARIKLEQVAIYRDVARAQRYYDFCDFQAETGNASKSLSTKREGWSHRMFAVLSIGQILFEVFA